MKDYNDFEDTGATPPSQPSTPPPVPVDVPMGPSWMACVGIVFLTLAAVVYIAAIA